MNAERFSRGIAVAAMFLVTIPPGSGSGNVLLDVPAPQKANQVAARQALVIPPIPPQQKQKILQMKKVKHDPSAPVRSYGFLHPIDKLGWLELDQANVFWQYKNADIDTNSGLVRLTFVPIAANKPHLLIFSVSAAGTPFTVQINVPNAAGMMQPAVTETVTPQAGASAAYVPVFVTPLNPTAYCNITISNSNSSSKTFVFQRVTMELVR